MEKDFEFVIRVVGRGENSVEAWEDAKDSAAKKVDDDNYDEVNDIS